MSKKFNLFLLNSTTDLHPRTWICAGGKNIGRLFKKLKKEVVKSKKFCKQWSYNNLNNNLRCSPSTIKETLRLERKFYPIPIILELLKFTKNKNKFLNIFKNNIEYLKVNSASAKPIKAVNRLNNNLAKILGAFMADGSLSVQVIFSDKDPIRLKILERKLKKIKIHYSAGNCPSRNQHYLSIQVNSKNLRFLNEFLKNSGLLIQTHYSIGLTDAYKDNVEMFTKWIKDEFNINPNRFEKKKNAWRVCFSNKILARYLIIFFEAIPGPKCFTAFEPKIIKTSHLGIRKSFARGALMFDGCVSKNNKILFSTVSKNFHSSIKQIWLKDKIKFGESILTRKSGYNNKITAYNLFTTAENKKNKLFAYFEPNTQKWKLLCWLSGNLENPPIIKSEKCFSIYELIKLIRRAKICDTNFIKNHFKLTHTTIRIYLKILKNQRKIRLTNKPKNLSIYIDQNATIFLEKNFHNAMFNKIKIDFGNYKNCAKFLDIHKATFSNWRIKKTMIPLRVLKQFCNVLKINFNKVSKNVEKIDREIAEII